MTIYVQQTADAGSDVPVEKIILVSDLVPDCIADAGKVRLGGLHRVMQWLVGGLSGGGG